MAFDETKIARAYSDNLFDFSKEKNIIDTEMNDLIFVNQVLEENPEIIPFIDNLENQKLFDFFIDQLRPEISSTTVNFLRLIFDNSNFSDFSYIFDRFNQLFDEYNKVENGVVISAVPLSDEQIKNISESFSNRLKISKTNLVNQIDNSIIGGVIIRTANYISDASIKTALKNINEKIKNEGIE